MKRLANSILLMIPGVTLAHPGHEATEQIHGILHSEHLLIVLAIIIGVIATSVVIKKL